jgi:transcriptional regulator with XRE-family HTH domain
MTPDSFVKALGTVIRQKREALDYSQESFAEKVGLHRTYVGAIERGERNITVKNFVRVALALGTQPSILMAEAEKLG